MAKREEKLLLFEEADGRHLLSLLNDETPFHDYVFNQDEFSSRMTIFQLISSPGTVNGLQLQSKNMLIRTANFLREGDLTKEA